eukprot:15333521-Heterocapsa_arctica.AAC.1
MESAPWRDGAERKDRGGYPPYRQEDPPWQVKPQIKCCRTCGMGFMAAPQGWSGYMHKNCSSRCTHTGGYEHTRRCRDKT